MAYTDCSAAPTSRSGGGTVAPLASLSDDELLSRLQALVGRSRADEVDLLRHLGEVDARRLHAREACPSMFAYCTRALRFSEAEAYLRITVARAAREHSSLLRALADGRLHLSAAARLAPHLTPDNVNSLVERAAGRSKREVMELVAELVPRPDAPSAIRALPVSPVASGKPHERRAESGIASSGRPLFSSPPLASPAAPPAPPVASQNTRGLGPDRVPACGPPPIWPPTWPPTRTAEATAASVQPLAPGRYRVQFTADVGLREKLERLLDLLGVAERDLARAIDAAVTDKLQRLEARRFAQTATLRRTPSKTPTRAGSRSAPAAVRRAVFRRDGGQCRFVDRQGRRCPARRGLEFHHRHPYACGGDHAIDNVQLLCRTHNRYVAELDFGRACRAPDD
jgi:5-methylcytosine-specific restriction endonuclease McrA